MFKLGELVCCIDNRDCVNARLTIGKEYKVEDICADLIAISDDYGLSTFIRATRFSRKVEPKLPIGFTHSVDQNRGCFWMVKGDGPTSYEHHCEESANKEAERLAKEHVGQTFFVLGPLRSYRKSDVQVTEFKHCLDSGESDQVPL